MKVLFLTAYYPPCNYGWGYMRICEMVADGLAAMGHKVAVLTSTYRHGAEFKPYPVYRLLPIDPDWTLPQSATQQFFFGRRKREQEAVANLQMVVEKFKPDVLFIWHGHGLPRLVLQTAENLPNIPAAYYFANYLPEMPDEYIPYWEALPASPIGRLVKGSLGKLALWMLKREGKPIRLKFEHTISVSGYVRHRLLSQGLIGRDAVVIPNGVDLEVFQPQQRNGIVNGRILQAVIAGRVAPEKGIHTVIRAFGLLHQRGQLQNIHLTIIGGGPDEYKTQLQQLVDEHQLQAFVRFESAVSVEQMPTVYDRHDILMLPSEWDEPLSCTMLEAMAVGLLVIGTTTGGSGEALFHHQTGLVFGPGDAEGLAEQISAVIQQPTLLPQLAQNGQNEVIQNFNMQTSVERIEHYLLNLIKK